MAKDNSVVAKWWHVDPDGSIKLGVRRGDGTNEEKFYLPGIALLWAIKNAQDKGSTIGHGGDIPAYR